jgi:hypothetical protein
MILSLLTLIGSAVGQEQQHDPATRQQRATAVELARTINTAEINYFTKNGRYAELKDLVAAGLIAQDPQPPAAGWRLRLLVVPDGKGYVLSVIKEASGSDHWGLYSDETGIIYPMRPLQ